jgi:superfamily II DNA/RNA helicase
MILYEKKLKNIYIMKSGNIYKKQFIYIIMDKEIINNSESEKETQNNKTITEIASFDELGLKNNLLRGLYAYGFETPSSIQKKAIMPMIQGKDLIAQSQSGTGKTGTFAIGTLQLVNESIRKCQAIILAPTRELAQQIYSVISSLSSYMKKLDVVMCIGGTDMAEAKKKLSGGAQIVVGTPGRIIKMISTRMISTRLMKAIVLDEADELLSHSFVPQIKTILENIPSETQICLFSATMPRDKIGLTKYFMNNPVMIFVKRDMLTLEGISQFYIAVDEESWKFDTLCDLYDTIAVSQSIIYVNTKKRAIWLKDELESKGFTISVIHSDMESLDRMKIMEGFRKGSVRILVSTDLLARGIDIQQVSIVLNYDIPRDKQCYLHRIGRSGRYGRKGVAINFVTRNDERYLHDIERYYSTQIAAMPMNVQSYL